MSSERHVRLKPDGPQSYSHTQYSVGASQRSPDIRCSDEEADYLLSTGKFEAPDCGCEQCDDGESDEGANGDGEEDEDEPTFTAEDYAEPDEDAPVTAGADEAECGVEMSSGETCERPADDCPYHGG